MGIMLTVIKKVMPSQKWVAEPVLLSMMQAAGLPAATSEHFSAFYKTHPGLLDSLMTGAGLQANGFDCISSAKKLGLRFFTFFLTALFLVFSTASMDALHDEIWVSGRSILLVKACGVIVDQD